MLIVDGVSKAFSRKSVLRDVSFTVAAGECVGLVGPSGGGKSVLLKIIGGVIPADRGQVRFSQKDTTTAVSPRVGFLFQESALFDSLSVLDNVAFPLWTLTRTLARALPQDQNQSLVRRQVYEQAYLMLEQVGLKKAALKTPGQLSGGMRRRAGIARALVHQPELVLLDDPTGGLDPVAATVIINLILELHHKYLPTIVMVSHDIRRLLPNVARTFALFDGRIVYGDESVAIPRLAPDYVVRFLATRYDFPQATR